MQKRPYGRTGIDLSIIGFGAILVTDTKVSEASRLVARAVRRVVRLGGELARAGHHRRVEDVHGVREAPPPREDAELEHARERIATLGEAELRRKHAGDLFSREVQICVASERVELHDPTGCTALSWTA